MGKQSEELSVIEASIMMNTYLDYVQKLCRARLLKARKVNGEWRIERRSVELRLARRKQSGRAVPSEVSA